jgi:HK97 family phage prohead protease
MEGADFSGYATKAGLRCSDGRTITAEAFKHQNDVTVPLIWQHGHNTPENVLGHVVLKHRDDGMYCYAFFNDTPSGQNAKKLVKHKDINKLSIWANELVEKAKTVLHGKIKEVSLVLSGANPGALIDFVAVEHSDGTYENMSDEAIIYTGLEIVLAHSDEDGPEGDDETGGEVEHAGANTTLQDVWDSLSEDQQNLFQIMVGAALEGNTGSAGHSDSNTDGGAAHQEGNNEMTRNTFETATAGDGKGTTGPAHVVSHSDMKGVFARAFETGSLKTAVREYALAHGIDNIDVLFPEAKTVGTTPEFLARRMEWVAGVLGAVNHTPFSRIKTRSADITMAEARAKGYVKGTMKKEEFFNVTHRVTTPTTVYKKQKLDRDDILDITEFDAVNWIKQEMNVMLREELATAILLSDGRDVDDPDKITDPEGAQTGAGIRSVYKDHELYVTDVEVNIGDASSSYDEVIDGIMAGMTYFKGSGSPTFYTTLGTINAMLLQRDTLGRRKYASRAELAQAMGVGDIVAVERMEDTTAYPNLLGIVVNLSDYNIGTDAGGDIQYFDFFDIDFNQYKYLIETRCSGALTKLKSALRIIKSGSSDVLVDPVTSPTFDPVTGVVTIPTQTHVVYKNADTGATLSAGAQTALAESGDTLNVVATPSSGFYFAHTWYWSFTRD